MRSSDERDICPRRPHKKSRWGCVECKRRHIKCDERRPKCVNCTVSRRACSYEELVSKAPFIVQPPQRKHQSKDGTPVNSPNHAHSNGVDISPPVNKLHLELLHHFVTNVLTSLGYDESSFGNPAFDITNCALTTPYLMNQALAFSALHMSIIHLGKRESYRNHASQLQTHALSEFNETKLDITPENCLPAFLFSSLLAMHVLGDKLLYRPHTFEVFLDEFIQSLRMYHGVRIISNRFWDILIMSPLKDFFEGQSKALAQSSSGHECLELLSNIDATHSDTVIGNTYRKAIEDLQRAFDGSRTDPLKLPSMAPIVFWPVRISPAFIDLLSERRPEALIILSHFGALIYSRRDLWVLGDSGLYIISAVKEHLGPSWSAWLKYPNSFI